MRQNFYYGVTIPSLGRKVYFKELTIGQLKAVIKTILNNEDNALSLCFNEIIKENCREDADALGLSIIDQFLVLLNMRVVGMGGQQKLQVTCDETKKLFSISYDYNQLITELETVAKTIPTHTLTHNNITVTFGLPLASRALSMEDSEINRMANSIKEIKIGPQEFNLYSMDFHNIASIIDILPRALTDNILKYLDDAEIKINEVKFINVVNPYTNIGIVENMSIKIGTLYKILKLAYKEDLHTLYKSIYYMVHTLKFSGEYVENLTYNEKQLYWSYYLADEREKQKSAKNQQSNASLPMRDATNDFLSEMP